MQPQLPLEVLDYILSFLQDDHAALRSCAAVNPVFSDMVERHLYHQVTVTNLEGYHGVDEFTPAELTKLFNVTPRLQSHVRVLRISIAEMGILRWFMKRSMNDEEIAKILPLFSQVTTVFLSGRHNTKFSWYRLQQLFQKAFIQLLTQATVENISINGIEDFPLTLLDQCTSLKRLSLLKMQYPLVFDQDASPTKLLPADKERAQLMSLDIGDRSSALPIILRWLQSPLAPQINHLSSLRITLHEPEDIQYMQQLLDGCSSELKEVKLYVDEVARTIYNIANEVVFPPPDSPHPVPDFSGIPSLKSLSIFGSIKSVDTFWVSSDGQDQIEDYALNTCVPWFIRLLQTLTSSPNPTCNLEHLILKIAFQIDRHSLTKLDWRPLAAILRSLSSLLPSLRQVDLHAVYHDSTTLDYATLMKMLRGDQYLAELVRSGLLVITGSVQPSGGQKWVVKL